MEDKKKLCPMMFANQHPYRCVEEECAWWVTYYGGAKNETSECVMRTIRCLYDMRESMA